jgi:hypothetical protein
MKLLLLALPLFAADLVIFKKDGKRGFYDPAGTAVIEARFEDAWNFSEGLGGVKLDGKWGFINEKGKLVIPAKFENPEGFAEKRPKFKEGLSPVKVKGKFGFIDKTGKLVVPAKWAKTGEFSEGLAAVDEGAPAVSAQSQAGGEPVRGFHLVAAAMQGKWGFIDKTGKVVVKPAFQEVRDFKNGVALVKSGEKWGALNAKGAWLAKPQYEHAPMSLDGLWGLWVDKKYALADKNFKPLTQPLYNMIYSFSEGLAAAETPEKKWGFLDTSGALAIPATLDSGGRFQQGLAAVTKDGREGYIDRTGAWAIAPKFRNAEHFSEGLAAVDVLEDISQPDYDKNDAGKAYMQAVARNTIGKWGYIDKSGAFLVEARYTEARQFKGGFALVKRDDKWTFVDKAGKEICPPKFDEARYFEKGAAAVKVGEAWGVINASCAWVREPK